MSLYRRAETQFWWCRFEFRGKEYRLSTGKIDKREAATEERRLRSEAEAAAPEARRRGVGPLTDLAAADIERAIREGADAESETRTLTSRWTPLLAHFGADRDIATITLLDIESYASARRKWVNARGTVVRIAGQTIRRELAALRRAFLIAKKHGWVARIPDPDEWPRLKKDPKNLAMRGKLRSPEVLRKLLDDATDRRLHHTKDSVVRDHLVFAVTTGLRAEELPNVRTSWVELLPKETAASLGVPAILRLPDDGTKTDEERYVALPQEGLDALERRKEMLLHPDCSLFPHKSLGQWLRRYSARINVKPAITLRDLRHTYSTLAMAGTGDPTAVMRSMGHRDLTTTEIYQSTTVARAAAVSVAVARAVFGAAPREVGTEKPAQEDEEPAKSLILQHARLAQLDRALVSEARETQDIAALFNANNTKKVQENPAQCKCMSAQFPGTGTIEEIAGEWAQVRCMACDQWVVVEAAAERWYCPGCERRIGREGAELVLV